MKVNAIIRYKKKKKKVRPDVPWLGFPELQNTFEKKKKACIIEIRCVLTHGRHPFRTLLAFNTKKVSSMLQN